MPPDAPKISILMPSFNQGPYLEAAIQSVLTQDYPNKELIVIDGGSTDASPDIIRRYQSHLAYSVSEPDRGQAHALNKALPHASGEIIGWLNSDDCYLPGAFRKIADALARNPDAILAHGDRLMIDRGGRVAGWTVLPPFNPATSGFTICSETAFWLRNKMQDLRFDENLRFAMDLDFFCRLYHLGRFVKLDHYLGAFRCHDSSKSTTLYGVGLSETEMLWKKIFPAYPDTWKIGPPRRKFQLLLRLFQHPFILALPYLYRRFYLRLRGT